MVVTVCVFVCLLVLITVWVLEMRLQELPYEVLSKCLKGLEVKDLNCFVEVFPDMKPIVIYTKYSQPCLKTSQILPDDLVYLKQTKLMPHPRRVIIDSVDDYWFNFLVGTFNVALDLSLLSDHGLAFYKSFLIKYQIPVDILTSTNLEDYHQINVRVLKMKRIPVQPQFPDVVQHLDLSFIGLDEGHLAQLRFPKGLKTLDLSNNCVKRVDDGILHISHVSELSELNLSNNDIYHFALNINSSLQILNLSSNLIFNPTFIINGLSAYLEWLNLSYNLITSLVSAANKVNRIELYGNYI